MAKKRAPLLTNTQSKIYGEKLLDLGNFALVGLVFAQLLPGAEFDSRVATIGLLAFLLAYLAAYFIIKMIK